MNHIQIGQRRLHQDHVRALTQVLLDLAHGLAQIRAVHLIGAPIAKLRNGIRSFAERSIKRRGELGCVGEDRHLLEAILIQLVTDRCDPPVHHVGWRNHVRARFGERSGCLRQQIERCVIVDVELVGLPLHHSAVTVRGVFAQADIRDQHQLLRGCRLLQSAQPLLHDAVCVVGAAALLVLCFGQTEEQQSAEPQ